MEEVELVDWDEFENEIRKRFGNSTILIRNFSRIVFDDLIAQNEIDLVEVVRASGTDRTENSTMWNAPGFDYDHYATSAGKLPHEIIYAYLTKLNHAPYFVSVFSSDLGVSDIVLDLTESLTEHDAITIYDPKKLTRAAPNEYWFKGDPRDAVLLIVTIKQQ